MTALSKVVLAGVRRRRAQTVVLTLTVLTAVAASVLAAGLLVGSRAPFDRAFAEQHGAHVTAEFDGSLVDAEQLATTADVAGVAAAAGPYPTTSVRARLTSTGGNFPAGIESPPLTVVGRDLTAGDGAGGPVDDVALRDGDWATGLGEIVIDASSDLPPMLGMQLEVLGLPGTPTLTVVGIAQSAGGSAAAWVTPEQLAALTPTGTTTGYQMLYRLDAADTDGQVEAGRAAVEAAVPAGAMTASLSYLDVRKKAIAEAAVFVPFVAAFGILGLAMSTLIIGIVVSGAVGAATWRIGVLKSLGFTPTQVVRAFVGQTLVPASVGVGLGVLIGNLLAVPVLEEQREAFSGATPSIPLWVDLAVVGAALSLVVCAALLPALRAARLRSVEAIAVGRTPGAGRGRFAKRAAGRLPLPAPLRLGLASPFARPARSAVTAAAVAFGAVGITIAVGLGTSLAAIETENGREAGGQVVVRLGLHAQVGEPAGPSPRSMPGSAPGLGVEPDPAAVAAAVAAQPGTSRYYGVAQIQASAQGVVGTTDVAAYSGDASWAARPMISGSWFSGPGEAVADTQFLKAAGVRIGDTVTLTADGATATVRIVGEVFDLERSLDVMTGASSVAGLGLDVAPSQFDVELEPGTDVASYVSALDEIVRPLGGNAEANLSENSTVIATMEVLIGTFTLLIVAVAVLGVFNTVVLDTTERVHDLGVFKALGMTPRQTVTMVVTSVAGVGAVAGLIGVPLGVALHHYVVPLMGEAVVTGMPRAYIEVYDLPVLVPLALAGLVVATAGALLPAGWAASTRTATALRTE